MLLPVRFPNQSLISRWQAAFMLFLLVGPICLVAAQADGSHAVIPYRDILEVFFAIHDPTSLDRQGNDSGPQYRSVIFYDDDGQRAAAREIIGELEADSAGSRPIVTELRPATTFYAAEDYHQEYFRNNPQQPYCAFVVSPKVKKFREKFASLRRL